PIEPHMFMRAASSGVVDDIKPMLNTMFCSACGLCELYSCFQDLSPRTLISAYKSGLRAKGVPIPKDSEFKAVAKDREFRMVPKSRLTARLGLSKYNFPAPLVETDIPAKKVKILLSQHIGAPAEALVAPKDKVKKGQLIAEVAEDKLGVSIHASISGTVVEVNEKYIVIKA
ncbi:MAG: NADH-quinone oxidoreductase subunit J, partial [Clostridia bacterium]|nr:NADH-quinone oxidoreductase subunit J [Clostridia bacterium]